MSSSFESQKAALDQGKAAGVYTTEQYNEALRNLYDVYGSASFNIGDFENLLGKLEGSKMRQAEQKGTIDRRGTMTQGLASMMSNF